VLAGVLVAAAVARDDGLRAGSVVAVATIATASAARDTDRHLPRDTDEVPPAPIGRKAPAPVGARVALPHHPNGLAHLRDLLSSAGAALPGDDGAVSRGADLKQ
jgi:hypothetical protein